MNNNMNEFKDLINLMKAAPKVPPPDGFAQNVMERLPAEQGFWERAWNTAKNMLPGILQRNSRSILTQINRVPSKTECSFYFFITGFFYLIVALALLAGFRAFFAAGTFADWIGLQPYLTLGAALWLIAIGALLMLDGRAALKVARWGSLLFIFFAVFNGIWMQAHLRVSEAVFFVVSYAVAGTLMGSLLAMAVNKMEKRTA